MGFFIGIWANAQQKLVAKFEIRKGKNGAVIASKQTSVGWHPVPNRPCQILF